MDVLSFPEIGEVSLFKNNDYQCSVSIRLDLSQVRSILFVFDTKTGPIFFRADVLDAVDQMIFANATCRTFTVHQTPSLRSMDL